MKKLTIKQVEELIRETEGHFITLISHTEESDGGTLIYHTDKYTVIIDYNLTGLYHFSVSTMKENDDVESNHREIKSVKAVLNYIYKFC